LQATPVETTNPKSEYQAKIEEYWLAPNKYRTIESPGFSQTLVVNGDKVFEDNSGDYFPWWLNEFVTAIFDPLPMLSTLKQSDSQIPKPADRNQTCPDLRLRADRWVICFGGSHGLLQSVFMKGYSSEFKDYKKFADKNVARLIENDPEPRTDLQAKIVSLAELTQPDEKMFEVQAPTPETRRIRTIRLDEETVRKISVSGTDINWLPVGEGLTRGGCAVYISADRTGQVREVWPGGCDNAGLEDNLRAQVKKWRLKPTVANSLPVQVTSLVTFTFQASQDKSKALPELSDADVRKLAFYTVPPDFPPGPYRREAIVQISVDETGKLTGVNNLANLPSNLFLAADQALSQWRFRPYVVNGKAQYFHAIVVFPLK